MVAGKIRFLGLHVQNLPKNVTQEQLTEILKDQGIQPVSISISTNPETKLCENGLGTI